MLRSLLPRRLRSPERFTGVASGPEIRVTVGVTSHNEAERIGRCLDSLLAQTVGPEHIEVLVVDDGSRDSTVKLARSYAERAEWGGFHVVQHRATGSPSKGRNTVLDSAAGEYVFFVDADDYLGPDALQAMLRAARSQVADIVVGRYVGVNRSAPNVLEPKGNDPAGTYHAGWLNSLHVQKLFRTAFLRGLPYRFNESLVYASDHPFMVCAFLHADSVTFVDDVDCYFITLEEPDAGHRVHVSRAEISAVQQLQFLHDCFGVMALARGQGGGLAKRAGRMRADYWNRLLKLHVPMLILRKHDAAAVVELARQTCRMAELYGARTSRARLVADAHTVLEALESEDPDVIRRTVQGVRAAVAR
ncbi:glycosyltransferase family 2 protein [Nesterenkonia natronophila]|uniref:glycosyltransferase family 2 protein n=1 Tax=Nesterenkonia natronophila TaxID=2174932 RepID=UPI0013143359|nr:glycosyltransferase family 2 protein [Nesterenkonia natronophila]